MVAINRLIQMRLRTCLSAFLILVLPVLAAQGQISRLPHPDSTVGNFFGVSVSIDGNRALVGASAEDSCGINSGAAYVFERVDSTETWTRVARLQASDCEAGDFFGRSLSLSGDRALIASAETFHNAAASNAAYVFERNPDSGEWRQTARLTADMGRQEGAFATSVSLDGDRALITTSGDPSNSQYGGAAYVFDYVPETYSWERTVRLEPSKGVAYGVFGGNGVLDGDRVAIAASTYFQEKPGSVYVFERGRDGKWSETDRIPSISDFFISLDLEGDLLLVGESKGSRRQAGAASLYEYSPTGWKLHQRLRPGTPYDYGAFGTTVSLSGDRALVVGFDEQLGNSFNIDRVVYVFNRVSGTDKWEQVRVLDIGQVAFGSAIDLDGVYALIGSASEEVAGAAYIARLPAVR